VVALEVEEFDAAVRRLREHGVKFLAEPHETPVCHLVTIADPDGNLLIIHKRKLATPRETGPGNRAGMSRSGCSAQAASQ